MVTERLKSLASLMKELGRGYSRDADRVDSLSWLHGYYRGRSEVWNHAAQWIEEILADLGKEKEVD